MITSVRFCLLCDLLNETLTPSTCSKYVYFNENLHCRYRCPHDFTSSGKKCYVMCGYLFMTGRHQLNNSNVV